jgi:hypothetical protein
MVSTSLAHEEYERYLMSHWVFVEMIIIIVNPNLKILSKLEDREL